ncbi:MAG: hypothetical protein ACI906_004769 [Candidatus Latescibacterota bacterium]|jgi:hypothetical protein
MVRVIIGCLLVASWAWAEPHDLIIVGSGGERAYEQRFADWQQRLKKVLITEMGHAQDEVHIVADSLHIIERAFRQLKNEVVAGDVLFVWLIGHGSFRDGVAKLNIPGPDLSAGTLDLLLRSLQTEQIVLVNTASVSSAFINVLSENGRIICTSTRSIEERNAPLFMEHLLTALESASADQNRDGRISVLEICAQASVLTQASYSGKELLATEHALIDDDGDGLGSRLPLDVGESRDGAKADTVFVREMQFPAGVPEALVRQYEQALVLAEAFIAQKGQLSEEVYYQRLEALFIEVARTAAQIWPDAF